MKDKIRVGFHQLHEDIRGLRFELQNERPIVDLSNGKQIRDASKEWCYKVTDALVTVFKLVEGVSPDRRVTHQRNIESMLEAYLGHSTVLFRYKLLRPSTEPEYLLAAYTAYSKFIDVFLEYVWALKLEFPDAEVVLPEGHPDRERDFVAMRLGRERASLDSFVSNWHSTHGADLPWVIRKPGLPWLVDLTKFEEWRLSSEGDKATVKKKVGRPPKSRLK